MTRTIQMNHKNEEKYILSNTKKNRNVIIYISPDIIFRKGMKNVSTINKK